MSTKGLNELEEELFRQWRNKLNVTEDEFVSDGLLFHGDLVFDGANWVRTNSGNNTQNWYGSTRRLLIITRDQPCDDGNIWVVRGETPISPDGFSVKRIRLFKCLIPWSYAALLFDNDIKGICPNDEISQIGFWLAAPIARMNCSKLAGKMVKDGGCPRWKVEMYLNDNKDFILEQISMYNANIIMCCSGYDNYSNPIVDFIKNNYLTDLEKINNYLWYSERNRKYVLDPYHFSNFNLNSDKVKLDEAEHIRDSIIDAVNKGCFL